MVPGRRKERKKRPRGRYSNLFSPGVRTGIGTADPTVLREMNELASE
jgi:hypothetical protein